jgi:hypothetical protein
MTETPETLETLALIELRKRDHMNMNLDVEPDQLAKWLAVPLAQRTRMYKRMAAQFGPTSAAAQAVADEISDIQQLIDTCKTQGA